MWIPQGTIGVAMVTRLQARLNLPVKRLSIYDIIRRGGDVLPTRQESPVKPAALQPYILCFHIYVRDNPPAPVNRADGNIWPLACACVPPHPPTMHQRKSHLTHICAALIHRSCTRPWSLRTSHDSCSTGPRTLHIRSRQASLLRRGGLRKIVLGDLCVPLPHNPCPGWR